MSVKTFGYLKWYIIAGHWVGICAMLIVLVTYIPRKHLFPSNVSFHHVLSILLALFGWTSNVFNLYETGTLPRAVCVLEAVLVNYGTLTVVMWSCIHAYNMNRYILGGAKAMTLKRFFPVYLVVGWVFPIVPTLIGLLIGDISMLAMYCWIRSPRYAQVIGVYLVFMPAIFVNAYLCLMLIFRLRSAANSLGYRLKSSVVLRVVLGLVLFSSCFVAGAIGLFVRVVGGAERPPDSIWLAEVLGGVLGYMYAGFYVTAPDVRSYYSQKFRKASSWWQSFHSRSEESDRLGAVLRTGNDAQQRSNRPNDMGRSPSSVARTTKQLSIVHNLNKYNRSMFVGVGLSTAKLKYANRPYPPPEAPPMVELQTLNEDEEELSTLEEEAHIEASHIASRSNAAVTDLVLLEI